MILVYLNLFIQQTRSLSCELGPPLRSGGSLVSLLIGSDEQAAQLDGREDSERRKWGGCGAMMLGSQDPAWGRTRGEQS